MAERSFFDELSQGMRDWSDYNSGRITLKTHSESPKKISTCSPEQLKALREKLRLSPADLTG
ncbi:hypothetical protein [Hafnia psychrotolerans]|uniref:Transcriptional regulator n=1 Tax=Hafnia psychrotolerans TaxID=1477018 RepID=A0ABQ1G908_9GAMM|nr:hypothetical protein [Hafnia psychrotolerans]GGA38956.1 hypothetical protein GCM10011328_12280 [Hafnia psychrotolerans]